MHQLAADRLAGSLVSILTGPGGPVLQWVSRFTHGNRPWRRVRCFNPHRARRPGATSSIRRRRPASAPVSILTGPEGPVPTEPGFPSSSFSILTGPEGPVLLPGSRTTFQSHRQAGFCFNPHRAPEGPVTTPRPGINFAKAATETLFNPHRARGPVPGAVTAKFPLTGRGPLTLAELLVSILTGPEARCLSCCVTPVARKFNPQARGPRPVHTWFNHRAEGPGYVAWPHVSILTPGPEARCYTRRGRRPLTGPRPVLRASPDSGFQSSPGRGPVPGTFARTSRLTGQGRSQHVAPSCFQSLTGPEGPVLHSARTRTVSTSPGRRPGATPCRFQSSPARPGGGRAVFQPPGPRPGAPGWTLGVSILTGPEARRYKSAYMRTRLSLGRRPGATHRVPHPFVFQSSPGPEALQARPSHRARGPSTVRLPNRFNPHRAPATRPVP